MTKQTNSKKTKKLNQLDKLLQDHNDKFTTLSNGKIKCLLTNHEFLPSQENLIAHMNSKSYKKATEAQFDITQYEEVLSTHKDNQNFLFCRLTGAKVPKKKTAIEKHVNGKKFKARFQEYKAQLEEEENEDDEEDMEGEEDDQVEDNEEGEELGDEEQEEAEEQEQEQEQEGEEQEEEQYDSDSQDERPKKNGKHDKKHSKGIKKQNHKKSQSKKFRHRQ